MVKFRPISIILIVLFVPLILFGVLYLYLNPGKYGLENKFNDKSVEDAEGSVFEDLTTGEILNSTQEFRGKFEDQKIALRKVDNDNCKYSDYLFKITGSPTKENNLWKITVNGETAFIPDFFNFKPLSGRFEISKTYYAGFEECKGSALFSGVLEFEKAIVMDLGPINEETDFLLLSDDTGEEFGILYYPRKISLFKYDQNKLLTPIYLKDVNIGDSVNYVIDRSAKKNPINFKGESVPSYHNPLDIKFILVVNGN
ncbi:MAG TPA: hypothetical protein VJ455_04735 [Ignavibacteria bacterium]|uniref:Uncharacterized protein n=1 Tax=candidate division WWE3 bacterium RIFCSPHIGHO2_02_FULL_38_14 TaxID=1802620 RepID=A0A1F4V6N8_UNCKA|nr:MAG: hypothetical protein A2793_03075 [candidate division WWE3 bacterium RIFCSPHIGHO2_01_FULL_38_45]OGC48830.1 MAG: hypothetical protein A3F07_03310 [candidate division WWE3 bacterium RIFCSPHIGHO2_12_FULL_38_15]OGC52786.1 MAG: hypothetical protein A3D91_02000 [candidate division WWE3 bacterium RIFCSPHIGHO2_02_FULL_38_14]OGC53133.1 MAG: hypothetical protein A3B64_01650 [candidate division WWE3 bacterium RIFCSPLOWO2_01_FULL_37_24]HJY63442.1 hypothetical protein [Ignavibacteria bacterium]HLB51